MMTEKNGKQEQPEQPQNVCSMCGGSQQEVGIIISGPNNFGVCGGCAKQVGQTIDRIKEARVEELRMRDKMDAMRRVIMSAHMTAALLRKHPKEIAPAEQIVVNAMQFADKAMTVFMPQVRPEGAKVH